MLEILIIDDDSGVRDSLRFHFEDCGYNVTVASSGESGRTLLIDKKFDIAIVDLRLPKLRGDDLILNVYSKSQNTKFIMFTGSEEYTLGSELTKLPRMCKKVFYKPLFDLFVLNNEIDKLIN